MSRSHKGWEGGGLNRWDPIGWYRRSVLTLCRKQSLCVPVCVCSHLLYVGVLLMCMHRETGRERGGGGAPRQSVIINQAKVQPVAAATAIFLFFYPLRVSWHLTLPSSLLLISSTSTSAAGLQVGGGGACVLRQMRSVDVSHQTGADQRSACARAGAGIKPHHAQPPRRRRGKKQKASPHEWRD